MYSQEHDLNCELYEMFCELTRLFNDLLYEDGNEYFVNPLISKKVSLSIKKYETAVTKAYFATNDSMFVKLACEMYNCFDHTYKSIIKHGEPVPRDVFVFDFLSIVVSLQNNILAVLDHWCDDYRGGHGKTLVKIVPAANCNGIAYVRNVLTGNIFPIYFKSRSPFYVPAEDGKYALIVTDFSKNCRTVIARSDASLGFDSKLLCPPFDNNQYTLLNCD